MVVDASSLSCKSPDQPCEANSVSTLLSEREAVPVTRAKLEKDGALGRIASHIQTEKTLHFLFEQATKGQ